MRGHVHPTQAEKLRAIAVTLRRVYAPEPAKVPDTIKEKLSRLREKAH